MRVFISHTSDLAEYPNVYSFVDAAKDGVLDASMSPVEQAHFAANPNRPSTASCAYIEECDVWIGIIGLRYGTLVPESIEPTSYVELEYRTARDLGLPCLVFLLDEEKPLHGIPPNALYDMGDPDNARRQRLFRRTLKLEHIVTSFTSATEVRRHVALGLLRLARMRSPMAASASHGSDLRKKTSIPFLRNDRIVGREEEIAELQSRLRTGAVNPHSRVVGIVGLAGIGKTQLMVEYAYRSIGYYTDGIYWINAAEPLINGFAKLGVAFNPALGGQSVEEQILCATDFLDRNPRALLIIDNLDNPRSLLRPIPINIIPAAIECPILYSSRRHSGQHFSELELKALDAESGVQLLTRNWRDGATPTSGDSRYSQALAICRMLGMLPLALEIASSHLRSLTATSLVRYRRLLENRGALPILDGPPARLTDDDLATRHSTAVLATLLSQWELITNEDSKALILLVAQLAEGITISESLIRILAFDVVDPDEHYDRCAVALDDLASKSLIERLSAGAIRLHPLVNEFCRSLIQSDEAATLRSRCVIRAAHFYEDGENLLRALTASGILQFLGDLANVQSLSRTGANQASSSNDQIDYQAARDYIAGLARVVRQESGRLGTTAEVDGTNAAQQLLIRARLLGENLLADSMRQVLISRDQNFFDLPLAVSSHSSRLLRTIEGSWKAVHSTLLSDAGRSLFLGTGNVIRKIAVDSDVPPSVYSGHSGDVQCLALSRDGERLASGSDDATVRIWLTSSVGAHKILVGHAGAVRAVAFLPDGQRIASASHDGTIRLWDIATEHCEQILRDFDGGVEDLAIDEAACKALAGSRDGSVRIWDLNNGTLLDTIRVHKKSVECVKWIDSETFVSGSLDRSIAIWSLADGRCLHRYETASRVTSVECLDGGRLIISGGDDTEVTLRYIDSEQADSEVLAGHSDRVTSLSVAPIQRLAVSGAVDGIVRVWNLDSGLRHSRSTQLHGFARQASVCLTRDERVALSAGEDGVLSGWSATSGGLLWQESLSSTSGHPTCVAADSRISVFGTGSGLISILDTTTGSHLGDIRLHDRSVAKVELFDDVIIVTADDGRVSLWDANNRQLLHVTDDRRREVRSLAVNRGKGIAVSGSLDGSIWWHSLRPTWTVRQLGGHEEAVTAIAISSDGRTLWSASRDATVRVWSLDSSLPVRTHEIREDIVNCFALSPDGRWAAAGSRNGNVILWEGQRSGILRLKLQLPGPIAEICYPNSRILLAVTRTGSCQAIDLSDFEVTARAELGQAATTAFAQNSTKMILGGVTNGIIVVALMLLAGDSESELVPL